MEHFYTIIDRDVTLHQCFKPVKTLYGRMSPLKISRTLEMSKRLVNEYITLIEEKGSLSENVNDFK
jgi:hypothetical protein